MLVRLLITITRDELKLLENHSPHSVLTHGARARQPLPPSCPLITLSSDPGEGKVAGNNTERERGAGRVGNGKSRVLKVLEDSTECRRPKERRKKREGGAAGANQTGPIMLDMPMTRDHMDRPTLSLFHTLAANKPSWALHTSWKPHTHTTFPILYKPTVATPDLMLLKLHY